MKKLISLLMILAVLLSLCACGGQTNEPTNEPTAEPTVEVTEAPTEGKGKPSLDYTPEQLYGHIDQTKPNDEGIYKLWSKDGVANMVNVPDGNFELLCNIDMEGMALSPIGTAEKPFTGTIEGNGHRICNVTIEQTNNSKTNAGLFGSLTETTVITDLHLQNVSVTIKSGTRMAGTSYGLLAGTISDKATLTDVTIADSALQIDSSAYFGTDDYAIGLVCGMGNPNIDHSGIVCQAVGADPNSIVITVTDGTVTVAPATT